MHGHGHPELAKNFNDKIPKTVDEMFKGVRAFIRGEVVATLAEMVHPPWWDKGNTRLVWSGGQEKARNRNGPREVRRNMGMYTLYSRRDTFTPLTKTPNEILAMESINRRSRSFRKISPPGKGHPPEQSEKWKLMEERCKEELTFPAIPRNSLTDEPIILEGMIEGHQCRASLIGFSGEAYHPLGVIDLRITMGEAGRNKTVLMEFAIVKCHSPYNVLIGRTRIRSLGAVVSTIHSMIKFPTNQGVITMETSKEAIWECRQLEKTQNS
ncbi:hypothetical protein Tco_1244621 [Tanacetum coccineum]